MRFLRRFLAACAAFVSLAIGLAIPAEAHTGFASSDPADGATLEKPVEVVTVSFTGPAEPTGDRFEVLDGSGELRTPTETVVVDESTFELLFDPPLSGGGVGVRWMVKAPDAHPIDGAFTFTVNAEVPAPSPSPTPTAAQAATPAAAAPDDVVDPGVAGDLGASAVNPPPGEDETSTASGQEDEVEAASADRLDDFLDTSAGTSRVASGAATVSRMATVAGSLVGVGALIFAATVVASDARDVSEVLRWVRWAGALTVVGAVGELIAQVVMESGGDWAAVGLWSGFGSVLESTFGFAVGLRVIGGLAMALGIARSALAPTAQRWQLSSVGPAVMGAVALLASFLFHGHSVVKGNRVITGATDLVHVLAASVWVGGIVMLTWFLWRGSHSDKRLLALRFSGVASVALVAVAVAGVVLAIVVLDSFSQMWTTGWGRTLVAKIVFVLIAVAGGGYNHQVLVPALAQRPDDLTLAVRFRTVVTVETCVLVLVVATTAILMGASL